MVIVKQQELHELLSKGARQAHESGQGVLVSQITRVSAVDPLTFFASAEKLYGGERCFWSDAGEDAVLVALGTVQRVESEQQDRFNKIEKAWEAMIKESIIDDESGVSGTGPLLVGGFSFDPVKEKSAVWHSFPNAGFVLPRLMLTKTQGETWLTVNAIVHKEDNPHETARQLEHSCDELLANLNDGEHTYSSGSYKLTEIEPEKWKETVAKTAAEIRSDLIEKVVLSRELHVESGKAFSPAAVLKRLYDEQPHSFVFAIERGDQCFLGASPERLVKRKGEQLFSTCVAGSIARGQTETEDAVLGEELLGDKKNLHEHQLVVDMTTEAMRNVCGRVDVPERPTLYKVRDIQHLYTPVIGKACSDTSLLSMVEALHPTPALGGFPQKEAVTKIRELEKYDRGWYSAPVGWIDYKGDGEFAVAIRSGLLHENGASLFAGCGIVGDSNPESEYKETQMKFRPMLSALGGNDHG